MSNTEIAHNRFSYGSPDRRPGKAGGHYGIKGRGGKNIHIHHNTIEVNFSIEFPFEGNQGMEIDHNILHGVVSIPKHGGGAVLKQKYKSRPTPRLEPYSCGARGGHGAKKLLPA
jgi:nitrous oxidase accessory protein